MFVFCVRRVYKFCHKIELSWNILTADKPLCIVKTEKETHENFIKTSFSNTVRVSGKYKTKFNVKTKTIKRII